MRRLILVWLAMLCGSVYGNSPTVVVGKVEEVRSVAPVHVNGVVRSRNDVRLPARAEGQLLWSLEEGMRVAKGDVLAQLDRSQLELLLREQELLAERADVNKRYLQGEVDRLTELEKNNLAARTQLAEMVSRRDLALNDLNVARARIAQLEEDLARTEIVSPIDGVIVERILDMGEYARVGDTVARVVNPRALEIVAAVPVTNLNRIDFERDVDVVVGGFNFPAGLVSVIHAGDITSQTFDVIVEVPESFAQNLVSGQFVEVDVPLRNSNSTFVPRDAVVLRAEGNYVFRISDENVAHKISVVLGEGHGNLVSIVAAEGDLKVGDKVAIRGVESLQDGQEVVPVAS